MKMDGLMLKGRRACKAMRAIHCSISHPLMMSRMANKTALRFVGILFRGVRKYFRAFNIPKGFKNGGIAKGGKRETKCDGK